MIRSIAVVQDAARDALLTDFGKTTLRDRYLLPGETNQGLFARVATRYAGALHEYGVVIPFC